MNDFYCQFCNAVAGGVRAGRVFCTLQEVYDDGDRVKCGALWEHALTTFCSDSTAPSPRDCRYKICGQPLPPLHASSILLCPAYSVFIQAHPFAQHCSSVAAILLLYVDHGLIVENLSPPPFFVMVRNAKRASVINV